MLNVITNIILSMMVTLSSNVSVTLEKNQMTQQSYAHLLNAIVENEKQNSFLNKEFNDNITYNLNIDNNLYNQLKNDSNIKVIINKEIKIEKDG